MAATSPPTSRDAEIVRRVTAWQGVTAADGPRGELSLRYRRRELGHLHGDRVAHFAFPKDVWGELIAAGRVVPHPLDRPGLAARPLRDDSDVDETIALMRLNYDRAVAGEPRGR